MATGLKKVWPVSKDTLVGLGLSGSIDGLNLGAGNEHHNLLGRITFATGDVRTRHDLQFLENWDGVVRIEKAEIVETVDETHGPVGGSAYAVAQRVPGTWPQGSQPPDGEGIRTDNGTHWGNQPGVTGTASEPRAVPVTAGKTIRIDVTAAVEEIAPETVLRRDNSPGGAATLYGFRVIPTNAAGAEQGTNAAFASGFKSKEGGNPSTEPYLELTFSNNHAPNIPTDMAPTGGDLYPSTVGTTAVVASRHSDPDGDASTRYQAQWYPDGSTDESLGTATKDQTVDATTVNNGLRSHTFTGLAARTYGKWRMRFWDGQWGPWCPLQRAKTAYKPGLPAQPAVTPGTLTPDFFASIVSSDTSDFVTAAQVIVYQYPAVGSRITKWDSGKTSIGGTSTRAQLDYGGTLAVFGTSYRWIVRIWNRDDVESEYAGEFDWKPLEAIGAAIDPSTTEDKIDTRTPTFRVTDPGAANIDKAQFRWYNAAGTLLSDSGIISFTSAAFRDFVTPAGIWDWGQDPKVSAAVRLTGNADLGPFSELAQVHINAQPGAPYPVTVLDAIQRSDDVWIVPSEDPDINVPFRDTDLDLGYPEHPTLRAVEVRDTSDTLLARIVRDLFAIKDQIKASGIVSFDQPGSLVPTSAGWAAGTSAALSFDDTVEAEGTHALKVALTNLATATTSTQTLIDGLRLGALYTDLSAVATFKIFSRISALPAGILVSLRFIFSGSAANFAAFTITPSAINATQEKTLTRASPTSSGGSVNWAEVSGLELRISHTAGSNQSLNAWVDGLRAIILAFGTTSKIRALYDDTAAVRSDYSEYAFVKPSELPVLTLVSPTDASTVTTPRLLIQYGYSATEAQVTRRVQAYVAGDLIYDSGNVATNAVIAEVPAFTLPNDSTIDFLITATDTDGSVGTLEFSVDTDFTTPDALTGLTVTPDPDAKALIVTWDADALDPAEFVAYYLDARSSIGDFMRIATIEDPAVTEFVYVGAPHNLETVIRLTQTNGYDVSEPVEESGELDVDGFWWMRPEPLELRHIRGGDFHEDTPTRDEEFAPYGRGNKVVLTWDTYGAEWTARMFVPAEDRETIEQLRADKAAGLVGILKAPDGHVYYSKIRKVGRVLEVGPFFAVDISGTEVGAAAGSF